MKGRAGSGGMGGIVLLRIHFSHPGFIQAQWKDSLDLCDHSHDLPAAVEC